ncbi:hypothetical protein J5N97_013591 [Dioscorea zingiberensis]|uniref:Uncharacterized protein n=1 Tax=Dioscorea zingiberensis TaxID=325984 RepID=A0A9D5CT94_9LILI|nr:hypothetical protein J5N97_013591 [Dioscorea zingiberensis]
MPRTTRKVPRRICSESRGYSRLNRREESGSSAQPIVAVRKLTGSDRLKLVAGDEDGIRVARPGEGLATTVTCARASRTAGGSTGGRGEQLQLAVSRKASGGGRRATGLARRRRIETAAVDRRWRW